MPPRLVRATTSTGPSHLPNADPAMKNVAWTNSAAGTLSKPTKIPISAAGCEAMAKTTVQAVTSKASPRIDSLVRII